MKKSDYIWIIPLGILIVFLLMVPVFCNKARAETLTLLRVDTVRIEPVDSCYYDIRPAIKEIIDNAQWEETKYHCDTTKHIVETFKR